MKEVRPLVETEDQVAHNQAGGGMGGLGATEDEVNRERDQPPPCRRSSPGRSTRRRAGSGPRRARRRHMVGPMLACGQEVVAATPSGSAWRGADTRESSHSTGGVRASTPTPTTASRQSKLPSATRRTIAATIAAASTAARDGAERSSTVTEGQDARIAPWHRVGRRRQAVAAGSRRAAAPGSPGGPAGAPASAPPPSPTPRFPLTLVP